MNELMTLQNRGYCLGFHDGKLTNISQNYEYTRTLGDWIFAGSIVEWQGDEAIFELRNCIEPNEEIEFLSPYNMENIVIRLSEFEDAETGEITPRVSAGQGKKIRIPADKFGLSANEIKQKLPQYTIARKFCPLKGENAQMLRHKKQEFAELCENCKNNA